MIEYIDGKSKKEGLLTSRLPVLDEPTKRLVQGKQQIFFGLILLKIPFLFR